MTFNAMTEHYEEIEKHLIHKLVCELSILALSVPLYQKIPTWAIY